LFKGTVQQISGALPHFVQAELSNTGFLETCSSWWIPGRFSSFLSDIY